METAELILVYRLYRAYITRILIEVDDLGDSGSPVDNWHCKRRSLSWVWEGDDSFLLRWTGTIFLTEVSNAKYIVPYKLDEHLASELHDAAISLVSMETASSAGGRNEN